MRKAAVVFAFALGVVPVADADATTISDVLKFTKNDLETPFREANGALVPPIQFLEGEPESKTIDFGILYRFVNLNVVGIAYLVEPGSSTALSDIITIKFVDDPQAFERLKVIVTF